MIIIGSRGSTLALSQAEWVKKQILNRFPDAEISVIVIKTSADRDTSTSIRGGSATGVFVKEIEEALLSEKVDIAVHSMKDVPTRVPEGLKIAAVPEREDARDAFIAKGPPSLAELPHGSVIGTGSVRRQAQILALRPDLRVLDIRGNVETRLQKLQDGAYDAIILACAGLSRIGLQDRITARLDFRQMLPAPGQGALAIEIRRNDPRIEAVAATLNHSPASTAVFAERTFLQQMGGGCNIPVAAHARFRQGMLEIEGLVASLDGTKTIRESVCEDPQTAQEAAVVLADKILARGGRAILEELR